MRRTFQNHIEENFPDLKKSKLLLACSGGLDSMVLADLLLKDHFAFALAHCNYKLRGEDSNADELLVQRWGEHNAISVYTKTIPLTKTAGSIQLQAREERYRWFANLMKNDGFDYVLTAHHADDTMETFFINLLRGTGLDGLTGIPKRNGTVIRPLLPFSKVQLLQYAKEQHMAWREDSSNAETKYVRNAVRLEVLPKLHEINADFGSNFKMTQHHLLQNAQMLEQYAKMLQKKIFEYHDDEIHISTKALLELKPIEAHLHLLFHSFGFTHWKDMKKLLQAQSGKEILSNTHRLVKDRQHIILMKCSSAANLEYRIEAGTTEVNVPIHLTLKVVDSFLGNSKKVVFVDKEKLNYPLKLRKWKIGDYFYPFGMQGRKKLSKFFKDEKFSTPQKENQWLLCSGDDVIWVVGQRFDDRFKVTTATKTIVKLTWNV